MNHRKREVCLQRGLSLLELLLAMSITVMVAGAIAAMLGAVSSGIGVRRDNRAVMVLSNAAQSRLSAYIAPSSCVLSIDGPNLVLWLGDSRQSGTVHATELRWFLFDSTLGVLNVLYVDFPDEWSQAACDLEDNEYPSTTDWMSVLAEYQAAGWIVSQSLVDNLDSLAISTDLPVVIDSRHIFFELGFSTDAGTVSTTAASTIRLLEQPVG